METKEIFNRTVIPVGATQLSSRTYNLILGLVLCWGFYINWIMVQHIPVELILSINHWVFLIGYFISCFFGIYLFNTYDKPIVSFIGYNFVVVPFGLVINVVVARYNPEIVLDAVIATGCITALMMVLGTIYPGFFKKIAGGLTVALISVIIFELVAYFVFNQDYSIIDWIVAAIFCGYIGYDWARANQVPKTVDNAIDCAAALYMDIINLFLRILRIMGRKR